VAESAAQVDMGTLVVAMDLEICECRLGSNVIGDQRPALGPGEGRGQVSRKVLEPTRSAERTDDPLWYSTLRVLSTERWVSADPSATPRVEEGQSHTSMDIFTEHGDVETRNVSLTGSYQRIRWGSKVDTKDEPGVPIGLCIRLSGRPGLHRSHSSSHLAPCVRRPMSLCLLARQNPESTDAWNSRYTRRTSAQRKKWVEVLREMEDVEREWKEGLVSSLYATHPSLVACGIVELKSASTRSGGIKR